MKRALVVSGLGLLIGIVWFLIYMFTNIKNAESLVDKTSEKIQAHNSKPSRIYSADNKILFELNPIYKENISLSRVPKHMIKAILAAEDKRYYEHPGVDWLGLARASVNFVKERKVSGGGSTITMQLAKRLFSASEVKMQRKVQDIAIAINMEKRYTKDQILEIYLNTVYFGEQAYGIAAASSIYFNKEVEDLTLGESAMLARCVRTPARENPVRDYQTANMNKNVVLRTMFDEGWITQKEYNRAKNEEPEVQKNPSVRGGRILRAPYFVRSVIQELRQKGIELTQGGYTVVTTLDAEVQKEAEAAVAQMVESKKWVGVNAGAFICMDSEGRILADVGGLNPKNQVSRTTQSIMQPGSSFKAFVYAEALKEGVVTENSMISNARLKLPGRTKTEPYMPRNSHGGYGGSYSLFSAFAQSMNVPAVRTFWDLGPKKGADLIKEDFGFTSKLDKVASLALGSSNVRPIEMLRAYSVFMLEGRRAEPYRIKQVLDASGEEVLAGQSSYTPTRIGPEVCQVMDRLLRGVVTSGTGASAGVIDEARGKTGTTDEGKDLWFCGYAKGIVGISWAGSEYYNSRRDRWYQKAMPRGFGGDVSAPMWAKAMRIALDKYGSDVKPDFRAARSSETEQGNREQEKPIEDVPPITDDTNLPAGDPMAPPVDPTGVGENPALTPPAPKREDGKKPEIDEEVSLEVCADSGMIATQYCPETITRKFVKSKRPKSKCKLHKAPEESGAGGTAGAGGGNAGGGNVGGNNGANNGGNNGGTDLNGGRESRR